MELIEGVNSKVCNTCNELKEFKEYNKRKTNKDGLHNQCKKCRKEYQKERYQNNKEQLNKYQKEYNKKNKKQINKYQKDYYQNNKEQLKKNKKEYRKSNKEEINKHQRIYYQINKKQINEYQKKYRKNNKEYFKTTKQKRRTLKQNSGGSYTVEQWNEALKYFNNKCAYSGKPMEQVSVEHIIPITKGGTSYIWNIIPCELSLNKSKNNKYLLEWYKEQEFYSEERLNKIYEYIEYMENKYNMEEII